MTQISVATWNLHHAVDRSLASQQATTGYLAAGIKPSIALLQEVGRLHDWPGSAVVSFDESMGYGTAVVALLGTADEIRDARSRHSRDGAASAIFRTVSPSHAAARVQLPGIERITAISLYGRIVDQIYSQTSVLHALADLMPIFDAPDYNGLLVVGGDLNTFNNGPRVDSNSRRRWQLILDMFEALGLVNLLKMRRTQEREAGLPPMSGCLCRLGDDCYHVETWRYKRALPSIWCIDYLFVSKELATRMVGQVQPWAAANPDVWQLSDHSPLVARFEL